MFVLKRIGFAIIAIVSGLLIAVFIQFCAWLGSLTHYVTPFYWTMYKISEIILCIVTTIYVYIYLETEI